MTQLQQKIDKIRNVNLSWQQDTIPWTKEQPYKEVVTFKQYKDPFYYFEKEKAEKIISTHSIRSDIYWINEDCKRKQSCCIFYYARVTQSVFNRVGRGFFYAVLIVLGCITGGFFWPRNLRRWILSIGVYDNVETTQKDSINKDVVADLATRIELMGAELKSMKRPTDTKAPLTSPRPASMTAKARRQTTGSCDVDPYRSNSSSFEFERVSITQM